MVLYLVGLGLGDEKDITVKGLEIVKNCSKIFLEAYTSILSVGKERLEEFYGKEITLAHRDTVESDADIFLQPAKTEDVALLVVGDPFGATTHTDLISRANEIGVQIKVVHNASIMNAVGCCGLQLYTFGQTVSMVFFEENWRPDSFYDKIAVNKNAGLHTLCLLDIKMREQTVENLLKGNKIYQPPRFMTINQCISQMLEVEEKKKGGILTEDTLVCGLSRVGQETQLIVTGTMKELLNVDFGDPLHCVVIPGPMHPMEEEHFDSFSVKHLKKGST